MPSMKCYECKKVKQCRMVMERGENEKPVSVYYCAACRRETQNPLDGADEGGEG